ncbi:hypothetical protein Pan97_19590 [Bremerella volcania]|uniref:Uncharacterized protein n=1 Tax=Bremerella volcania TaxID=2527984 RepID=A0A518C6T4_9BACT|nr:hypothetical protein [Bremerella volcania]QDU74939.1 hypothetical protein Pan97_19590 [Bremerella volcania]
MIEPDKYGYAFFDTATPKTPRRFKCEGFNFYIGDLGICVFDSKMPLWMVLENSVTPLPEASSYVHVNSRGWFLEIEPVDEITLPFLVTDNPDIRQVFRGTVTVEVQGTVRDSDEIRGFPFPVISEKWLGVLWKYGDEYHLIAYGFVSISSGVSYRAYNPEWSDGLDDEEALVFVVTLP